MVRHYVELPVMQAIAEAIRWAEQQRDVIKENPSVTPRQMPDRIRELPIGTSMDFATDEEFLAYIWGDPLVDVVRITTDNEFYPYVYTEQDLELLGKGNLINGN